jgi:predicted NACHT family NTPase/HEAT repeat protein
MEWMVIWGATQAAGFIFKPILEDLAKESAKDYAKDFFKDCLKKVIKLPEKDEQKEAYGKALTQFLQFFQQELDDADYQEIQIKQYLEPIKRFIEKPEIAAILGSAFEVDCVSLDTHFLAKIWKDLNLPFLPDEFSWERVSKRYLKKVKAIIQESDKLRPIFAVQTQSQMAENVQELVGIAPDFDLGRYAEGLREQYGNLKLESLDTTGVYYNELKLWKIFIAQNVRECQEFLPQVYEIPKDHIKRLRETGEDIEILSEEELERQRHRYINQQSQLVWEVISDPTAKPAKSPIQQVVILGDPGAGKSSLLQYIALIWAERPLRDLSLYPIPLLLELRIYARDKQAGKCQDILSFIHGGNITCRLNQQQLHEKLRSGQAVALFDGIDEIFDPVLREEVVTDIHRFSNDYAQVQVIITSRWLGYKAQRLRDAGFRHFMLQDLETEQIEDFIERWHELTFTDQADKVRKWERLQRAIQDSKSIRELAGNPLLLTMMAILNRKQELPRNRSTLYEKASEVLLYQWDVEVKLLENPKFKDWKISIELDHKQKMLRKVAYFMQSNKKDTSGNLISKSDLENILTESLREIIERGEPRMITRVIIEELRTRNFILCFLGADSYGFVHRTFLEYFCAWEFVWQFKETQTLTIDQLINEVFGAHWEDESWHEVLRLICGMIEPKFVAEIINFLLAQEIDRSDFLDEVERVTKEGLGNIILAANCFAEVRNRNLIATTSAQLLKVLKNEIKQESQPSFSWKLTQALMSLIAINWKEDPDTLPWFKHLTLQDENYVVQRAAVYPIAEGWKEDPDTLPWLKDRALQDKSFDVRRAAVWAIAQGWQKDPDTLSFLKDRALLDENYYVRQAAVTAIAQGWKEDPDTLPFLKDRTLQDKSHNVRYAAVTAIIQNWQEDPDALPFLKEFALQGEDCYVLEAAVTAIAQNWKEDPDTLPWLKDRALQDEDEDVRQAAVKAIAQGWKEDPDTLPFLKDRALQDEDNHVRGVAVTAIIQNGQKDPELFEFLANIALNDPFKREDHFLANPRQTALEALLENFSDNPKTLEILNQVALNNSDEKLREFAVEKLKEWGTG